MKYLVKPRANSVIKISEKKQSQNLSCLNFEEVKTHKLNHKRDSHFIFVIS